MKTANPNNSKETITNPVLVATSLEPGQDTKSYMILLKVSDREETAEYQTYTADVSRMLEQTTPVRKYVTRHYSRIGLLRENQIPEIRQKTSLRIAEPSEIGELVNLLNSHEFRNDGDFLRMINVLKPVTQTTYRQKKSMDYEITA